MNGGYARPESGGYRSREEERQYAIAMASIASKAPKRPMTNGQGSADQMKQMQNQRDQQQPYSPEELMEAQSSLRLLKAKMSQRRDSLSSKNQESNGQDIAIRSGTSSNGRTKISSKHEIQEFPTDVEDQQVGGGSNSSSRQGQNKTRAEGKKPPLSQAAPTKVVIDLDNRPLNPATKYQRPGSSKESTAAAVTDAHNNQQKIIANNEPLDERPIKPATKYNQGATSASNANNEQESRSVNAGSSSRRSLGAQPEVAKKKSLATQGTTTEITQNRGSVSRENEDLNAPPRQKQAQNSKKGAEVPINDDDRPICPATSTRIYLDAAGGAEDEGLYEAQYSVQSYHDSSQQQKSVGGYAQQQQLKKKQGSARGSVQNYTDSTATPDEASSSSASGSYGASRQNTNYRKTFVPPPEEDYDETYQQPKKGQSQPGKENYDKKVQQQQQQQQQRGGAPPPQPKSAQNSRSTNNKAPPAQQQISQNNNPADPDNRLAVAKLSSSQQAPLPVKEHEYVQTFQCPEGCGRRFNEQALDKHVNVCKKVFQSKRAAFDSQQHRQVEDQAGGAQIPSSNYQPQNKKKGQQKNVARPGSSGVPKQNSVQQKAQPSKQQKMTEDTPLPGSKKAKWKEQSESLRAVMRQNRGVQLSAQEQKAFDNAAYESEDLVVCPVCARKFNDKAAQKHIPFCKERSKVEQLRKGASTSQGGNNKRGMDRASTSSYGKKF